MVYSELADAVALVFSESVVDQKPILVIGRGWGKGLFVDPTRVVSRTLT